MTLGIASLALSAAPIKTPHAEVELIAAQTALVAGQSARIGLSIKHAPHWHTYWKNPGDSGYPTKVTWALPAGFSVSEFDWPAPKRLATGPIVNFGYEGEVLLPLTVTVPTTIEPGTPITLKGKAEWLVCKDVCIPEEGDVSLVLPAIARPIAPMTETGAAKIRFDATDAAKPVSLAGWSGKAHVSGRDVLLDIAPAAGAPALSHFDIFPEPEQINDPSVQRVYRTKAGYAVALKWVEGAKVPPTFNVVLTSTEPLLGAAKAGLMQVSVAAASDPSSAAKSVAVPTDAVLLSDASTSSSAAKPMDSDGTIVNDSGLTLWSAIAFAFVGGMILNLMPCVFPVLSLKILSFAQHAGAKQKTERGTVVPIRSGNTDSLATASFSDGKTAMRTHGIFYAIGVVLSFLALAGVLLALKSAGSAIGWGFQLQNPGVVWVLAIIFFLIGLNLMGAFEVGQLAPSSLLSMQAKHPGVDSFFSGVLAVIAASPCTAPFMGAALGFALTQSTIAALAVFAALGVGMALPYVLLSWFPKWLEKLPPPGAWMVTMKQVLAFPMFLTVVWLVWVIAMQAGVDGAAIVLLGLVGLAFAAWMIGSSRTGARWVGVVAGVAAAALAWPASVTSDAATTASTNGTKSASQWQPWDPATIAKLNAEGKPVFVDFTAAWCVSCQANKRLVLTRDEIVQAFNAKNVVLMRADWTNKDDRITKALAEMNRSGVPVYVLHAPGKPAQLLPELLTTGIVKEALASLEGRRASP
jgi:thiol:disulfide interchange protein/DsbC/DsbD-like thiol-disulfide interchange protein